MCSILFQGIDDRVIIRRTSKKKIILLFVLKVLGSNSSDNVLTAILLANDLNLSLHGLLNHCVLQIPNSCSNC